VSPLLAAHEAAARRVEVDGIGTALWDQGEGEPVLCLHGVPVSAWAWRKLLPALAARGLRGMAFDLPGMGLADRPTAFPYTWTAYGAYAAALVERLGLAEVHLVVHDIGGPVGFELARALPDRVKSLTVLNTLIEVGSFRKPWVMWPF
jgi:pimeloyl-ACP methyl ester carboxylesterase